MPATAAIEMRATPEATGGSTPRAHEAAQEDEPEKGHVAVAHVPAVEVEIGEEEDEASRPAPPRRRPGRSARSSRDRKDALEEAEIDAGIGEHRPGQGRAGKISAPLTTKTMVRNSASRPAMPMMMPL